jgi:hypothetical protein
LRSQTFLHAHRIENRRLSKRARESSKPANGLLSLKFRLELLIVVRICVGDPTLRARNLFHDSRYGILAFLLAFWPTTILRWPNVPENRDRWEAPRRPDAPRLSEFFCSWPEFSTRIDFAHCHASSSDKA